MVLPTPGFEAARAVAAGLGFRTGRLTPIGHGVASDAWLLACQGASFVLKLARQEPGRPCTYWSESLVMSALRQSGLPVPEVIAVSPRCAATKTERPLRPWLLVGSADGMPLSRHRPAGSVSQSLGRFLSAMHRYPAGGLGPLRQTSTGITGMNGTVEDGLLARWRSGLFWPHDGSSLSAHALAVADGALLRNIEAVVTRCMAEATESEPARLLHSDLHREHIFTQNGRLTAIIDFGGAFVCPISCEFAPIALFLGWDVANAVMKSYAEASDDDNSELARATAKTALIFGLYRYDAESRAGRLQREGPKIVSFLKESAKRVSAGC
jgi:aminoglycoside phosphotransferase (APT) family kinase protein